MVKRCDHRRATRDWYVAYLSIDFSHDSTGKSYSLWYIAIQLLQDYPLEPLLFIQPNSTLLFYRGNAYMLPTMMPKSQLQLPIHIFSFRQDEPSCVALVDSNGSDSPDYLEWDFLLPIFANSPLSK